MKWIIKTYIIICFVSFSYAVDVDRMIFQEKRIEGKIRRPQVVLIRADQRPEFVPMVMQNIGRKSNFADFVNEDVIESSKYSEPFPVMGGKVIYSEPD